MPKKSGVTVIQNEKGESIPIRLSTGWRACIDYRKLNVVIRNGHFPFPFMDQVLREFQDILIIVFLMATLVIFRLRLPWKIKKRQHLLALLVPMHIRGCHLVYAMLPPLFKDAY